MFSYSFLSPRAGSSGIFSSLNNNASRMCHRKQLNAFFVSLFFVLSRSRFVLVTDATRRTDAADEHPRIPTNYDKPFVTYSGEIYKEAAFGGSEVYGQSAGTREGRAGVHLPAPRGECHRLEGDPRRHHAREFHQQHRVQFLHRGHNVSTAACFPPIPHVPSVFVWWWYVRFWSMDREKYSYASFTRLCLHIIITTFLFVTSSNL